MASQLESVPTDILQQIAFFVVSSSSPLNTPKEILQMLLISSNIYQKLRIEACPHLYALIFLTTFDVAAPRRRFGSQLTDITLAMEYTQRHRLLRRLRRRDYSMPCLKQDLWTALWMVLEGEGRNEEKLFSVRILDYILTLIRGQLFDTNIKDHGDCSSRIKALVIWILCLTFPRREIIKTPVDIRQETLGLLRPFVSSTYTVKSSSCTSSHTTTAPDQRSAVYTPSNLKSSFFYGSIAGMGRSSHVDDAARADQNREDYVMHYARKRNPLCPDPSFAAINLISALMEADVMDTPLHLPETRIIANATQRAGPTMDDFRILESYRTPLFADTPTVLNTSADSNPAPISAKSMKHDLEFCQVLQPQDDLFDKAVYNYVPGLLTGLWQGTCMHASATHTCSSSLAKFECRQPMQCALSEYLCFSPNLPLPQDDFSVAEITRLLELEDRYTMRSKKYTYEKYVPTPEEKRGSWRDQRQAVDVIIVGETLEDHDLAWNGFRFVGRVHQDGLITFRREPKNAGEHHLGSWYYEGRLRFGTAFVGRWRSGPSLDVPNLHGIFSMEKKSTTWHSS